MGLERGVGQGFLWACLGPQLRAEKAQEEDQDWLLGSGKGLLLPGLCWVQALAQELGALGHPPEGLEWAQAALWS